jgi:putative selenate reductase molybdopterin-binding subunit
VPKVQQTPLEPYVCITHWDENDRLVIRTSTQVPFHARRILAPVLGLPIKRIRVIKPRIGGGFGNKQEVLIEDICAHLTIAGRPVKMEYTRGEQLPQHLAPPDDRPHAHRRDEAGSSPRDLRLGAADSRLTVTSNTGHKARPLPETRPGHPHDLQRRLHNTPSSGACGYGVLGRLSVECHMERIARPRAGPAGVPADERRAGRRGRHVQAWAGAKPTGLSHQRHRRMYVRAS